MNNSYRSIVIGEVVLNKQQVLLWIFDHLNNVYLLCIKSDKSVSIKKLENWDILEMNLWISQVSQFYFKDEGDYPINEQESAYLRHLNELKFATISIEENVDELLIYSSLQLSRLPHNLLQFQLPKDKVSSKHEYIIQQQINTNGQDFLSFNKPISNVISLEWYAKYGREQIIPKNDFSIEGWIPTKDEDIVLNIGYEKLFPVLVEKYKGKIDCNTIPDKAPSALINVFMAHGGKGGDGFKTLYTRHQDGAAYIKEVAIDKLFGKGLIAIVFVCHSASIAKSIYAQRLNSFVNEILSLGYKSVIAPAWALNPDIAPCWLDTFLREFLNGKSVSYATLEANTTVAKESYNEYHGFYDPTGWAAMHVFGNPNIKLI